MHLSLSAAATGGIPLRGNGGHSDFPHQVALARVERAKLGHANQLRGGDVQDIQRPAANGCGVIRGDGFRFTENTMPQAAAGNQQPGGHVVFHFLPGGLNFNRRQPLLKHGQIQGVPQFEAVKRGETR